MNVERQALAALKWSAGAKFLGQLISWAVTLVVLRILAPADYGLMAIVTVIISIIAGFAEFGLGASLIQSPRLDPLQLSRIGGALGALNIGCGLLVVAAAPWLAEIFADYRLQLLIQVSSLHFVIAAAEVVPQSLAQRELNFARVARIEIASTIVNSLSTLLLAANGSGVWALVIGGLLGSAARAALYVASSPIIWPSFRFDGIGRHVKFGGTVTLTRVLWQLTYQMDTLIAARFLTREALGLYSVAMHLATLPMNKAMGVVNQVAFPAVARLQDELPRLRARLLESLRLLAFIAIPALWGISAVAPEFIDVVLGEKWRAATLALQLVSLAAPLRMLAAVLATALAAIGRADVELRNTAVSAAILPLSFAIAVQWDVNGLAASWLVAVPLACAINFPRTSSALGLPLAQILAASRAPILAGSIMYFSVSVVRMLLQDYEELTRLPILVLVGGAAYLSCVMLLDRAIWTDVRRVAAALRQ
jgi:teichuronic acid exporter